MVQVLIADEAVVGERDTHDCYVFLWDLSRLKPGPT